MKMLIKQINLFSSYNKRNKVPKLLKDYKYTRKGIMKVKDKQWSHDLSSPHIINKHLYYDHQKQLQQQQHDLKVLDSVRQHKMQKLNLTLDQSLIIELKDREFVRTASSYVVSKMQILSEQYPQVLQQNQEMFQSILQKICAKFFQMDIDQILVLLQIYKQSNCNDQLVQKRLIQAVQKHVAFVNHHEQIQPDTKNKLQQLINHAKELGHEQNQKLDIDLKTGFIKQALA